jgi:hypothetical protein
MSSCSFSSRDWVEIELKKMIRYKFYERLWANRELIHREANEVAKEMRLDRFDGQLGLNSTSSTCPAPLSKYVWNALAEARKTKVFPVRIVEDNLRDLVKDAYGDDYDAVAVNTCESALRLSFDTLAAPPIMARGSTYRAHFIAPYTHDDEFMAGYGRPFPPKYKNLYADRSVSAGEAGVEAKALANLDAVIVKLVGAKYEVHGINYNTCPMLADVDPERSAIRIDATASRHSDTLAGFETIGDDTPGFGYGKKDGNGVPILQERIGELAEKYDVPYIVDAARAIPIIGTHPRNIHATVMTYSMDKVVHGLTSGLLIGREEEMVAIRKALGTHGERTGSVSSHGKAVFSFADPGRDAVIGQIAILQTIADSPNTFKDPVDKYYSITCDEFSRLEPSWLRDGLIITKSYHLGCVEINYEHTWNERFGIPFFTTEDNFTNTNLIVSCLTEMRLFPPQIYGGNIQLTSGLGDIDEAGSVIEENVRVAIRALVLSLNIVCKYAGIV